MGRAPASDQVVKKGPWTSEEDDKLRDYIRLHGHGSWRELPRLAGLNRCGKSCRLRWANYLRPDIKRGKFDEEEEEKIIHLHAQLGNKWSAIASKLPGRTDNEIKNHWNTHLRKKLMKKGIDPVTHKPRPEFAIMEALRAGMQGSSGTSTAAFNTLQLQSEMVKLLRVQLADSIIQVLTAGASGVNSPAAAAAGELHRVMDSLGTTFRHLTLLQGNSSGTGPLSIVSSGTPGVFNGAPQQTTAAVTTPKFSLSSLSGLPYVPTTATPSLINHSLPATTTMSTQQQPGFRPGYGVLPAPNPSSSGGRDALTWKSATGSAIPAAAEPISFGTPGKDSLDALVAELDTWSADTSASASVASASTATPSLDDSFSNHTFLDGILFE